MKVTTATNIYLDADGPAVPLIEWSVTADGLGVVVLDGPTGPSISSRSPELLEALAAALLKVADEQRQRQRQAERRERLERMRRDRKDVRAMERDLGIPGRS